MHPETRIHSYWFRPTEPIPYLPEPAIIIVDDDTISLNHTTPIVYLQCEPSIINDLVWYVQENASRFHTIFTYDHTILESCPNARFYIVARTWIPFEYYRNIDISLKEYKISTLAGSKCVNQSAGHLFRQALHYRQHDLSRFPITFFRSSYQHPPLPDLGNNPFLVANTSTNHKEDLFHTFQFAIIIENTTQRNCFSEKLIDCLMAFLAKHHVQTRATYPEIHRTPMYLSDAVFPVSHEVSAHGLFLPSHLLLTDRDIHYVCDLIQLFLSQ